MHQNDVGVAQREVDLQAGNAGRLPEQQGQENAGRKSGDWGLPSPAWSYGTVTLHYSELLDRG